MQVIMKYTSKQPNKGLGRKHSAIKGYEGESPTHSWMLELAPLRLLCLDLRGTISASLSVPICEMPNTLNTLESSVPQQPMHIKYKKVLWKAIEH